MLFIAHRGRSTLGTEDGALTLSCMGMPVEVVRDELVPRGCYRFVGEATECPAWQPRESRGPFLDLQDGIDAVMRDGHVFRRVHMHPLDVVLLISEAEAPRRG